MTGIQNGNLATQLNNFCTKLAEYDGSSAAAPVRDWQTAFQHLKTYLKTLDPGKKHVLFLDELPWIATPKSGFVQLLAHFWNDYLSKNKHFLLVICGSATSWISQKIINDPGGLHNRLTEHIHLHPFTIGETKAFLQRRGLFFSTQDVAKIYMMLGGVPYYLEKIQRGESVSGAIERICFAPGGILLNEYQNFFQALFARPEMHRQIVSILAARQYGLSQEEILSELGLQKPNGTFSRVMEELKTSDFIDEFIPIGKKRRGVKYRLVDEYTLFYHRFIAKQKRYVSGIWQQWSESQSYKTWTGYAFENICIKHAEAIKKALGISAVFTEIGSLYIPAGEDWPGAQIDLVIDRRDGCINLCEIKFHNGPYTIDKTEYQRLIRLRRQFIAYTQTSKQVFLTFITNHGLAPNAYSMEIVDAEVVLETLMEETG